jgi:hypothetical protein
MLTHIHETLHILLHHLNYHATSLKLRNMISLQRSQNLRHGAHFLQRTKRIHNLHRTPKMNNPRLPDRSLLRTLALNLIYRLDQSKVAMNTARLLVHAVVRESIRRVDLVGDGKSRNTLAGDSVVQTGVEDLRVEHGGLGGVPVGDVRVAADDLFDEAAGSEVHLGVLLGVDGAGAAEAEDHVDGGFFVDAVVVKVVSVCCEVSVEMVWAPHTRENLNRFADYTKIK